MAKIWYWYLLIQFLLSSQSRRREKIDTSSFNAWEWNGGAAYKLRMRARVACYLARAAAHIMKWPVINDLIIRL
ncbi:MAG: hypothetical protein MJE68_20155 [Proteobacteria bacterium]|nr:hypothetical protein [Pseudomonadota bacterium]